MTNTSSAYEILNSRPSVVSGLCVTRAALYVPIDNQRLLIRLCVLLSFSKKSL